MMSQATMSSALELPKVAEALKDRVTRSHLTSGSALRALFCDLKVPDGWNESVEIPRIAKGMAEQTAVNLEVIISAATIVLSHSTADDVFTGACELSIELSPADWVSELNLDRDVSLRSLIEKGADRVLEDELESFRIRLGKKSLPVRAEMLFRHVPVKHHDQIPKTDPAYFRMSALKEADDLRIRIVHGSGLPRIDRNLSKDVTLFLHEAAFVAIRSVIAAYQIPQVWDHMAKMYSTDNQQAAAGT
jgi:hypothetical protein